MTVQAVFFDLDGTLVDSLQDLTDAVNYMLTETGRPALELNQVRQLVGKGARNLVQRALESSHIEEIEQGLRLFTVYNSAHIADSSRLYPGIPEQLHILSESGFRMAVISNKNEALCRQILQVLEIAHLFECIAGGDTFTEMKPSPLPLLTIAGKLGLSPSQAVMIGDSDNDILAGIRAGIRTIGCRWGYGQPGELDQASRIVSTPSELHQALTLPEGN